MRFVDLEPGAVLLHRKSAWKFDPPVLPFAYLLVLKDEKTFTWLDLLDGSMVHTVPSFDEIPPEETDVVLP